MTRDEVKEYLYNRLGKYKGKKIDDQNIHRARRDCNEALEDLTNRGILLVDRYMPGWAIAGVAWIFDGGEYVPQPIFYRP